jgi:hypothetical protein
VIVGLILSRGKKCLAQHLIAAGLGPFERDESASIMGFTGGM